VIPLVRRPAVTVVVFLCPWGTLIRQRLPRGAHPELRAMTVLAAVSSMILYRYRNLGERSFRKIKHFRAVATRYDKAPYNFLASVKLAARQVRLRA